MNTRITDVDFRFYVQSSHLFANLQNCSSGYWTFIDHFCNISCIILSVITTGEVVLNQGTNTLDTMLPYATASLAIFNSFNAYMRPAAKAEAHAQSARQFDKLKLSFGNCANIEEYNHLTQDYQNSIISAPGLPFFLRKRWLARKESISPTPSLLKIIDRTDIYKTTSSDVSIPHNCFSCYNVKGEVEVMIEDVIEQTIEETTGGQKTDEDEIDYEKYIA